MLGEDRKISRKERIDELTDLITSISRVFNLSIIYLYADQSH